MARVIVHETAVLLWLSPRDTEDWADGHGPRGNGRWPCSAIAGRRLFAAFDSNGLYDMALDSGRGEQDCPGDEFSAMCADFLAAKVPQDHPARFVAVDQHL